MKIVFCLNHFLPDQVAGTEIYTLELAKELKAKGHQVLVVVPRFGKTENKEYNVCGIDVACYAETQVVDRAFLQNRKAPAGLPGFISVVENFAPDLVHFQEITGSHGIGIFHVKAMRKRGYKTLMTFHLAGHSCYTGNLMYENKQLCDGVIDVARCARCSYAAKPMTRAGRFLLYNTAKLFYKARYDTRRWQSKTGTALSFPFLIENLRTSFHELVDACDHLVSLTAWYKQILIKNGVDASKISYIPQGLRTQSLKQTPEGKSKELKLVFVGRITKIKGLHLLVRAMKQLPQNRLSLTIYGNANEAEYYDMCLKESEGLKNIFWRGSLQPADVVPTISRFDVLCLPSRFSEMSPLVIQEAFAAGLPVLASNVYGNAEQITHNKNGWLFQFENIESLREALQNLLSEPQKIERAKSNLPTVRSFATVADEYEALYKKMIAAQ